MSQACLFDGFGTVVDRHTSVRRDLGGWTAEKGLTGIDWVECAREWRNLDDPVMEQVRGGRREGTELDVLHRVGLVGRHDWYGLARFDDDEIDRLDGALNGLAPSLHAVLGRQGVGRGGRRSQTPRRWRLPA